VLSRRALLFLVLAVVSAVMVPVTPAEFRWVAWGATGLALFWTVVIGLEDVTRSSRRERPPDAGNA
jgi:predicted Na+-dependent transporter